MACLDENTVAAFVGGALPPEAAADVERHVEACGWCRQLVGAVVKGDREGTVGSLQQGDTLPSLGPPPSMPARGSQLGRYLVLDPIGRGGMGVVYAAYDPVLERKVAVKLVRTDGAQPAVDEVRQRLLREGKAIAQLAHPNIVAVFDMGTSEGQVFVAMELVEGGSLKQWLRVAKRSWREVLDKFLEAGQGLAAAHRAGLVHRDFKPENVLVGADGRVRVTDFGLARSAAAKELPIGEPLLFESLTAASGIPGTPAYMAPEQLAGQGADERSDQFSFCLSLWEALFHQRRFVPAAAPGQWTVIEPTASASAQVPPWLRRVLQRGLSLEREERFPSMDALLAALAADPGRLRRQRVWTGAAAAVLVAAVVGGGQWLLLRQRRLCTSAPSEVATMWNPAMAESLRAAFLRSGAAGAQESFELARRGLDAYFERWADTHTEACRATRILGEQSDQLLDLRMACLDRRRDEAAALLRVLGAPDADVVAKAPEAVEALVGLYACSDREALLAEVPPPESLPVRKVVGEVRALLDEGKARFDAGRYPEALARAQEAVRHAKSVDHRPSQAEALLFLGQLQEHLGKLKEAEETLLDALATAQSGKHDAVTAQAATHFMLVLGSRQARFDEANAWGKLAEGAIARIGGSEALQARFLQTVGLVRYAEGRLKEAMESHQRAVALLEKLEPDSVALAQALSNWGAALRGGRRVREAVVAFERALAILDRKVSADSDLIATAQNGIANAYMLEGRFPEAFGMYEKALESFKKRLGPSHYRSVTTVNNLGVVLAEQRRYLEALPYFEQVLEARRDTSGDKDARTADAHSNVGMLLVELARLEEAVKHFERARGILQGYPLDHFSQAEPLLGMAKVHLARREGRKAVEPLTRALALCEGRMGFRFDYTRARAGFLMGRALSEGLGRRAEGLERAREAMETLRGFGPERFKRDLVEMDAWLASNGGS